MALFSEQPWEKTSMLSKIIKKVKCNILQQRRKATMGRIHDNMIMKGKRS